MSKYTEAIEIIYKVDDYISNWFGGYPYTNEEEEMLDSLELAIEALQIADRLEQADADVYNKCCEVCTSLTICKERGEVCDEASVWEDGYDQALADIRGDAEWKIKLQQAE